MIVIYMTQQIVKCSSYAHASCFTNSSSWWLQDALTKMKDVYIKNPHLGDPDSIDPRLEEITQSLEKLQLEHISLRWDPQKLVYNKDLRLIMKVNLCYLIINEYNWTEGSVVCVFSGLVDGGGEEVTWKGIRVSEKTEQSFWLAGNHASYKQLRSKPREVLQSLDSRATKHDALNGMI